MKIALENTITIGGITYRPKEEEKTPYCLNVDTGAVSGPTVTILIYHVTYKDKPYSIILTAIGDLNNWAISICRNFINYEFFKHHQHIAPPDFSISFSVPIETLDADITEMLERFDFEEDLGKKFESLTRK